VFFFVWVFNRFYKQKTKSNMALFDACCDDSPSSRRLVRLLLEAHASPNTTNPPFYTKNDTCESDANPDSYLAPLHAAVRLGSPPVIDLLLAAKADVNLEHERRVFSSVLCMVPRVDIVDRLLDAGAHRGYDFVLARMTTVLYPATRGTFADTDRQQFEDLRSTAPTPVADSQSFAWLCSIRQQLVFNPNSPLARDCAKLVVEYLEDLSAVHPHYLRLLKRRASIVAGGSQQKPDLLWHLVARNILDRRDADQGAARVATLTNLLDLYQWVGLSFTADDQNDHDSVLHRLLGGAGWLFERPLVQLFAAILKYPGFRYNADQVRLLISGYYVWKPETSEKREVEQQLLRVLL